MCMPYIHAMVPTGALERRRPPARCRRHVVTAVALARFSHENRTRTGTCHRANSGARGRRKNHGQGATCGPRPSHSIRLLGAMSPCLSCPVRPPHPLPSPPLLSPFTAPLPVEPPVSRLFAPVLCCLTTPCVPRVAPPSPRSSSRRGSEWARAGSVTVASARWPPHGALFDTRVRRCQGWCAGNECMRMRAPYCACTLSYIHNFTRYCNAVSLRRIRARPRPGVPTPRKGNMAALGRQRGEGGNHGSMARPSTPAAKAAPGAERGTRP